MEVHCGSTVQPASMTHLTVADSQAVVTHTTALSSISSDAALQFKIMKEEDATNHTGAGQVLQAPSCYVAVTAQRLPSGQARTEITLQPLMQHVTWAARETGGKGNGWCKAGGR
jgi:hypothetical protein